MPQRRHPPGESSAHGGAGRPLLGLRGRGGGVQRRRLVGSGRRCADLCLELRRRHDRHERHAESHLRGQRQLHRDAHGHRRIRGGEHARHDHGHKRERGPVRHAAGQSSRDRRSAYALSASFGDAGVNDAPWAYAIDWGDGSPQTSGSTTSQSAAITASHTYAAGGTDTVRVTVTDKDGGAGSAKTHVTGAAVNHPPTAAAGGPYTGNEGAAVAFNGTGSSDPDGDAITYAWSFGDQTTGTGATPSHTYADNGTYTVSLTV